jgi:branched-chain amino acid transport system ATP-binding protein
MTDLLRVQGISKTFGGLAALQDVSFSVQPGEILGLIGPNGAGKTTLFNVVNGFYRPTRGEVFFKGEKISQYKPHRICKLGIGRTFQVVRPLQRLSVLDNVLASAFLRAGSKAQARERALELLRFTGLYEDQDVISKGLPLGKRKRLELTRALATQPQLLLMDESFAGLNPTEINDLMKIIREIRDRGITLMIIEHHMKVIMSVSDRIVVLNFGQKIAEGTPKEIGSNALVIEAYLGEAQSA